MITGEQAPSPGKKRRTRFTSVFWGFKRRAREMNLDFNLTEQYMSDLFNAQNGCCALSGVKLDLGQMFCRPGRTASLDRIDSSIGYTQGNVQWLHKDINKMKGALSQEEFISICREIAACHK